jgi:hypothetical protein
LLAKKSMWMTRRWRKCRDIPLADIVAGKLERRAWSGMADPAAFEAKIAERCDPAPVRPDRADKPPQSSGRNLKWSVGWGQRRS